MSKIIDLAHYRTPGSKVYAGRDRGEFVRVKEELDALDVQVTDEIEIHVPVDTFSLNSSFFLGLFGDSIRSLGEAEFRRRFRFTGRPVVRAYEAGIREALTTDSALSTGAAVRRG